MHLPVVHNVKKKSCLDVDVEQPDTQLHQAKMLPCTVIEVRMLFHPKPGHSGGLANKL